MPPKGSVLCFMCRAALRCEAGDLSKYRRHMKINHQVIIDQIGPTLLPTLIIDFFIVYFQLSGVLNIYRVEF